MIIARSTALGGRAHRRAHDAEGAKNQINDPADHHREVEDGDDPAGRAGRRNIHLDQDERDDKQIAVDKRDHAAETDPFAQK